MPGKRDGSSQWTPEGYWETSRRPLQILVFLLPPILLYEIGLAWLLRSDRGVLTNKAHESLLQFFEAFGVTALSSLYLGGIVIIVVLLVWHLLTREPWRINAPVLGIMTLESAALTLPLIAVGLLVQRNIASGHSPEVDLASLSLGSKLAISIGAGLYEELLFRMLLIAIVHTLLVDLAKVAPTVGALVAVVLSAAAFTWYHPLSTPEGQFSIHRMTFYFLAGLYFGLIFMIRGFGIAVAVHILYDVITVSLLSE